MKIVDRERSENGVFLAMLYIYIHNGVKKKKQQWTLSFIFFFFFF